VKIGDKAADGSQLRPFIVWFGEAVPRMEDAVIEEPHKADIFIIIGTSLNVYPAAGLHQLRPRRRSRLSSSTPRHVTVPELPQGARHPERRHPPAWRNSTPYSPQNRDIQQLFIH
jgi:NAD-dependent SIR2 family protein deacetylase